MLCHYNIDILNICMKEFDLEIIISGLYNVNTCTKEFGSEKIIFDKMTAVRT